MPPHLLAAGSEGWGRRANVVGARPPPSCQVGFLPLRMSAHRRRQETGGQVLILMAEGRIKIKILIKIRTCPPVSWRRRRGQVHRQPP